MEYITTSNLYWNRFEIDALRQMFFTDSEIEKCTATKGDLLVCEGGDFGRAAIWPFDYDIRIQNHIHRLRAFISVSTEFYYYIFYLYKHVGLIGGKGIGIQGLSSNALHALLIPLPPVEEQKRIAVKIKTIEPIIDKYSTAEIRLDELNNDFPNQLKKSILQQAVQGKLVPQDPDDEPASVLLERVRAEKEHLIAEGKIKRDKNESVIYKRDNSHYEKVNGIERCIDDEIPFDIPDSWAWSRFKEVVTIASNLVSPEKYLNYAHIAPDNIEKGTGKLLDYRTVKEDSVKSVNHLFHKGQLLYSKIRPALQKATIAPCDGLCSADMYPLDTILYTEYVLVFLLSETFTSAVVKDDTRVKMPKTNQNALNIVLIPIPPYAEQIRIASMAQKMTNLLQSLQ